MRICIGILAAIFVCGCSPSSSSYDSGTLWQGGGYELVWIDDPSDVFLAYNLGGGSSREVIPPLVFAVGLNEQYLVAKQHPDGDQKTTNYFVVNIQKKSPDEPALGPFTEEEFLQKSAELKLPSFTKVINSLK